MSVWYWGAQNWVLCSSSHLWSARHRGRITSLNLLAPPLFLYSAWYGIHEWVTSPYEWNAQLASYAGFETFLFCQEAMKPEKKPSSVSILASSSLLAKLSITLCLVELFMFSSSIMLLWDKSLLDAGYKCVCQWQHTDLWVLKNQ